MGDTDQVSRDADLDPDDEVSLPNLCNYSSSEESDSDSSDSEYDEKVETCNSETEEEDVSAYASATAAAAPLSQKKRNNEHLEDTQNTPKRARTQRNKSHACKLECLDVQEIKTLLFSKKCSCEQNCFEKLKAYKERAVRAIEKIRLQRFSGKLVRHVHSHISHPGVENNS